MNLSPAMQFFMREVSKQIGRHSGRINRLWGSPFFSSVISSPHYFLHAYKYTYRNPVAAAVVIHDWLWRPRGKSVIVSRFLLKRLNLIQRKP